MTDTESPSNTVAQKADVVRQIAKALVERRQMRALSIEKVSAYLKIRKQYLLAIEAGDWSQLPGEVYVRGFIKRYATYLGLDGDRLLAPYLQKGSGGTGEAKEQGPLLRSDVNYVWIYVGLAVVALAGLFKFVHIEPSAAPKASAKAPVAATPVPAETSTTSEKAAADIGKHQLDVFSPFPLWLRVTSKDRAFEGFISQGSTWTWKAEGEMTVRMGHTKQVSISFDGQPVAIEPNQKSLKLPE
jgi:cytoskeletal protein RodZ